MENLSLKKLLNFQDKQQYALERLLDPQVKYLLYGGAAGGGKSRWLRWAPIVLGMYYVGKYGITDFPLGLFSEDYTTLRDRQIIKIAQEFPSWLGTLHDSQRYGLSFSVAPQYGGFHVLLRNLDDPSKYSSVEFPAIFVEELTKNVRSSFDALRSRMRYPGIPEVKFAAATNPGEIGHHWVKGLWIKPGEFGQPLDPEQDRFLFVPARWTDNKYIDQGYVKQLDALPIEKRKALKDGSWELVAGQIFHEWRPENHVVSSFDYPVELCYKQIGFDWGYNNPGVAVWHAFTPDGRVYQYRELHQKEKSPAQWAKDIKIFLNVEKVREVVLPHDCFSHLGGNQTIATVFEEEWKDLGENKPFIVQGPTLGEGAAKNRVAVVHKFLEDAPDGKPWFQVHEKCIHTISTLPDLVYNETDLETVNKRPNIEHCYDALSISLAHHVLMVAESGAVKPEGPGIKYPRTFVSDDQGNIQGPDFWKALKEGMKRKSTAGVEFGK